MKLKQDYTKEEISIGHFACECKLRDDPNMTTEAKIHLTRFWNKLLLEIRKCP